MKKRYMDLSKPERDVVCFLYAYKYMVTPCDIDGQLWILNPMLEISKAAGRITDVVIKNRQERLTFEVQISTIKSKKS